MIHPINFQSAHPLPQTREELLRRIEEVIAERPNPTEPGQPLRAGIIHLGVYGRLSKVETDQVQYSLEIQPQQAIQWARAHNCEIYDTYLDPDMTGRNSKRQNLQRMIRDVKDGKLDVILVHRLDRLYRNLASLIKFVDFLAQHHVRLVSMTENLDTETAWGRLMLYVLGGLAEIYVRSVSERVHEAKLARFNKGLPNGLKRFGYCNGLCSRCTDPNGPGYCPLVGGPDRGNGRVEMPHPIERHARRLMEYLYSQGWSDTDIADYLNAHEFEILEAKSA